MSDAQQGPGWWLASDGKWYPPEQSPGRGWWRASDGTWHPPEHTQVQPLSGTAQREAHLSDYIANDGATSPVQTGRKSSGLKALLACGGVLLVLIVVGAIVGGSNSDDSNVASGGTAKSATESSLSTTSTTRLSSTTTTIRSYSTTTTMRSAPTTSATRNVDLSAWALRAIGPMEAIANRYTKLGDAAESYDTTELALQCILMKGDLADYEATLPSPDPVLNDLSRDFVDTMTRAMSKCTEGALSMDGSALGEALVLIEEGNGILQRMSARADVFTS